MDVMLKKELEFIEQQQKARNKTLSYKEADWFVNYNMDDNTTALVVAGADGIGVLFIVLKNDHIDDFRKVIEQYDGWSKEIKGSDLLSLKSCPWRYRVCCYACSDVPRRSFCRCCASSF